MDRRRRGDDVSGPGTELAISLDMSGSQSEKTGELATLLSRLKKNLTPPNACAALARLFQVGLDEVALLRLDEGMLKFLYPPLLRAAGLIPLSSPAVAARTAATKTALLSNTFAKVRHMAVFEAVKPQEKREDSEASDPAPIQKIMSAPIVDEEGDVLGVIQISRKGPAPTSAGPDFTIDDLHRLEKAAAIVAKMSFLR